MNTKEAFKLHTRDEIAKNSIEQMKVAQRSFDMWYNISNIMLRRSFPFIVLKVFGDVCH